jgi:hypothetical protein
LKIILIKYDVHIDEPVRTYTSSVFKKYMFSRRGTNSRVIQIYFPMIEGRPHPYNRGPFRVSKVKTLIAYRPLSRKKSLHYKVKTIDGSIRNKSRISMHKKKSARRKKYKKKKKIPLV